MAQYYFYKYVYVSQICVHNTVCQIRKNAVLKALLTQNVHYIHTVSKYTQEY